MGEIIRLATGMEVDEASLRDKANVIATEIRRFNLREGMTIQDERLPKALHQALKDSGKVITEDEMETMLKEYYQLHGWGEDMMPPGN